jgi:hypothetical protein
VALVPDERVETLVRALVEHLAALGAFRGHYGVRSAQTIALQWSRDGVVTELKSHVCQP